MYAVPLTNRRGGILRNVSVTVAALTVAGFVAAAAVGGWFYAQFARELPDLQALHNYHPSLVTRLYDRNDELVAEYYIEKRILVPVDQIPQPLIMGAVAVEDAGFFEHHGLNLEGIARAMVANLVAGRVVQGGSSITQQVAKQLLLSSERTWTRKFKEAILSLQIDYRFTKQEILEIYLNHIYYGHGAYGVGAASEVYFNKKVGQLTLAEMAMIAGLPKAPNNYSPYRNPDRARERRRHALQRMADTGVITGAQQAEADAEPFTLGGRRAPLNRAPWFAEHVRRSLEEKYGADTLYRGGLTVRTTLDLPLQQAADRAVKEGLEEDDKRLGWRGPVGRFDPARGEQPDWEKLNPEKRDEEYHLLDPYAAGSVLVARVRKVEKKEALLDLGPDRKGRLALADAEWAHPFDPERNALWAARASDLTRVLAADDLVLVKVLDPSPGAGGRIPVALDQLPDLQGGLLSMDPATGEVRAMVGGYDPARSKFNRATQARRQPGSSFKPLIYSAALAQGITPATIFVDAPIIYERALSQFKGWKPTNFEEKFFGPTTVREAVTHSRNVVTIKVLEKIGVPYAAKFAHEKFGIESPLDENLSMALGASPVTLLEMVRAYATLAAGGVRPEPLFITSVTGPDGTELERNEPKLAEALDPAVAYVMTSIMTDVVRRGTARKAAEEFPGRPLAGKTGTTNNNVDALFIGFTPDLVTGVWVGRDDNTPIGRKETGSRAALPLWASAMHAALDDAPPVDFTPPPSVLFVKIDRKTGLRTRDDSEDALFEAFVDGTEPTRYLGDAAAGGSEDERL